MYFKVEDYKMLVCRQTNKVVEGLIKVSHMDKEFVDTVKHGGITRESRLLDAILGPNGLEKIVKGVYVNEDKRCVTTVFNNDDAITIKCCKDDYFDANIGVALAVCQHLCGSKNAFRGTVSKLTKKVIKTEPKKEEQKQTEPTEKELKESILLKTLFGEGTVKRGRGRPRKKDTKKE